MSACAGFRRTGKGWKDSKHGLAVHVEVANRLGPRLDVLNCALLAFYPARTQSSQGGWCSCSPSSGLLRA